jgi:hypothetical protein
MSSILFNNDGFKITRNTKNNYSLEFTIENKNIVLPKIIDFNLFNLIYELNPDIYDKMELKKLNEKDAIITILMKNLFEDLGISQKFNYMYIQKFKDSEKIIFKGETIHNNRPDCVPEEAELTQIKDLTCVCYVLTNHKILISFTIILDEKMIIPPFVEKLFTNILFKIFKRVKQFIENTRI